MKPYLPAAGREATEKKKDTLCALWLFLGNRLKKKGDIMRFSVGIMLIIVLVGMLGCAGTGGQGARRDRYFITADEIKEVPQADSAWEVIRMLRPNLLERDKRRHVGMSQGMPSLVYVDGMRVGYKDRLQYIAAINILEIRYIDGIEAGTRYGTDAAGGIFFVKTIR